MKRFFLGIMFLFFLSGVAMANGFLNHPNLAHLNTFTASIVQAIDDSQAAFYAEHGRYFEGIWLLGPDRTDVDGTEDVVIDNATSPSDFPFTWKDFNPAIFKNNTKVPVNVRMEVYQAPSGWGWTLYAELYIDGLGPDAYGNEGTHWVYKHHVGPQPYPGAIYDEWYVQNDEI